MDIPHFLTHEIRVQHHECGPDGLLKLNCVLDYFQNIAAQHAVYLGVGMEDLQAQHQLWVLSRLKLKTIRMPQLDEKLTVLTYPTGLNRLFATRQYQLLDEKGEQCVVGTSFWIMIDDEKFRPVRPSPALAQFDKLNPDKERFYPQLDKIAEPEEILESQINYTVRHSHIDLNRHLNNAYYGAFLTDTLGYLTDRLCHPAELQINFLHPGAVNDCILCGGELKKDGSFYVEGRSSEDRTLLYFQAEGKL